ncbi:ethanolamine ammonia-lyase light chain [mine drainage metagenome]|uniref:Ethanolamine ammonia-lyase light chain n=1 Tax=mine drainage metagenome TaxID=410659 RepID=A0A1J5RPG3_9ZZZZ
MSEHRHALRPVPRLEPGADPWSRFAAATPARINLGRSGDALPTRALLEFQADHARARDAVHGKVEVERLAAQLAPWPSLAVNSRAASRAVYLRRPDLGRRLDAADAESLAALADPTWDLALVVADGLSAQAVMHQAVPTLLAIRAALPGWRLAPVVLARQARVALGDEVGQILQAPLVAVLVGERPGLSVADSLGIYLTYAPAVGCRDAARNCISNIHGAGLSPQDAAAKLAWLATHARRLRLTGVALKEDAAPAALPVTPSIPASYDSKEGAGR